MSPLKSCFAALLLIGVCVATARAQSKEQSDLQSEVDQLKAQLKAMRAELDQIKATLSEQDARTHPTFDITGSPSKGDASAKLVMIEFSDFQCPFCREYFKTIYQQVIDDYVKTGKVRYVFSDFPGEQIHPASLKAAEAGRCAAEHGKFWEMHDELFARQSQLGTTGITDAAQAAGLNPTEFQTCLSSGKYTAPVREAESATAKLGLQGTPAFVFGTPDPANPTKIRLIKALVGAQALPVFQQTIGGLITK